MVDPLELYRIDRDDEIYGYYRQMEAMSEEYAADDAKITNRGELLEIKLTFNGVELPGAYKLACAIGDREDATGVDARAVPHTDTTDVKRYDEPACRISLAYDVPPPPEEATYREVMDAAEDRGMGHGLTMGENHLLGSDGAEVVIAMKSPRLDDGIIHRSHVTETQLDYMVDDSPHSPTRRQAIEMCVESPIRRIVQEFLRQHDHAKALSERGESDE